ncbi:MAG: dihydroorotate dehydrogenase electron transfer subunit [Gammaproteobacteria bacterium]|nr:dihydroorotate dehydrogenase electron transfer subunit [Gammaproteobacteria bacterium]
MNLPAKPHRGTMVDERAEVLANDAYPGHQHVLKIRAPEIARRARPGSFVHLRCAPSLAMRRPMSIMRADATKGTLDILFKAHGLGTAELAARKVGETLSVLGPIGVPFRLEGYRRRPLLIGGGVGLPPMVYLAEHLRRVGGTMPLVVLGSEVPFPFTLRPSTIMVPGLPPHVIATMPLLEDWGIACRLASQEGYPGCFDGFVTELAAGWIEALGPETRDEIEIFACGPTPMLKAVQALAARFAVPAQVSLEEYMACAVGGCAGCTVRVNTPTGPAMKRVCVDGPVFEASTVVFE